MNPTIPPDNTGRQTEPDKIADNAWWLALLRTPGIGAIRYLNLLEHFGHPRAIMEASFSQLVSTGVLPAAVAKQLGTPDWSAVENDLAWLEINNNHIITIQHRCYPPLLKEIPDPPPLLYIQGNLDILSTPQLAIVGSRNPSPSGSETAHEFSHTLAQCGLTITSGLALGIDADSHRGALAANGKTIAVTGTGLDQVYPARNKQLAKEIIQKGGAIVSEFPLGTAPMRENFPRRNRIISGLSLGTLVAEAALRSGSLITARLALEQGREVFAIPGSIHNPLAKGCHNLIRQGAKLVEKCDDILEELGPLALTVKELNKTGSSIKSDNYDLSPTQYQVLESLGFDPVPVDTLVDRCGLTADELSSILLVLELQNYVMAFPGGLYSRRGERN